MGQRILFRPKDSRVKYFFTSVGLDPELNGEIKKAYRDSDENLDQLKQYIKDNKEKIIALDTDITINAIREGTDDEQVAIIKEELIKRLPKGGYNVEIIGEGELDTGITKGLIERITIE